MKKTLKRLLALALVVCSILSYAVPAANAAGNTTVSYDFNQYTYYRGAKESASDSKTEDIYLAILGGEYLSGSANSESLLERYNDGALNWTYEAASAGICGATTENDYVLKANEARFLTGKGMRISWNEDQWIALRIKSPGEGDFSVSLNFGGYSGSCTAAVYIMEAEGEASVDRDVVLKRQEVIYGQMDPNNRVGKADLFAGDCSSDDGRVENTAYLGDYTFEEDKEYIVVVENYHDAELPKNNYIYLRGLTITDGAPAGSEIEGADFAHEVLVQENAVPATDGGYMGAVHEVNGHDYYFLPQEGGKMMIFDLDKFAAKEDAVVMQVTTGLHYPTSATVTPDGKVIVGNSGRNLYIFDTNTMTGKITPDFRTGGILSTEGHTAGVHYGVDTGKVYFGTSSGGHLVQYDMDTRVYEDLGDMVGAEVQRLMNPNIKEEKIEDNGGVRCVVEHNGYLYAVADSASYDIIVKYSLEERKPVAAINATKVLTGTSSVRYISVLGDEYIIVGGSGISGMALVDIETFTMVKETAFLKLFTSSTSARRKTEAWESGMTGHATEAVDGKQYFFVNGIGLYSYNISTGKMAYVGSGTGAFKTGAKASVTMKLSGDAEEKTYLFTFAGGGQPRLYNPKVGQKIALNGLMSDEYGTGGSAINIGDTYDGVLYIGAWNNYSCVAYDTGAEAVKSRYVTGGQTDSQTTYVDENGDFHLYSGNYSACVVYEIDPDHKTDYNPKDPDNIIQPIIQNMKNYEQKRIHTVTAGDGYVFAGTIPESYINGGGVGVYNIATGTEDFIRFKETSVNGEKVVPNSELHDLAVTGLVYYDGRLYGATTRSGGTNSDYVDGTSAQIFVMNYEDMTIEATLDLRDYFTLVDADNDGSNDPIDYIGALTVDEKGRFWGLVSDVLFCFTYDKTAKTFKVQRVLALDIKEYEKSSNAHMRCRKIAFDSENNLLVSFFNYGMQQITLLNWNAGVGNLKVIEYDRILTDGPETYAVSANDNLFYAQGNNLYVKPLNVEASEWAEARAVDNMIEDLGKITLDKADAVAAAREAYNSLPLRQKALVQEILTLEEAEALILGLQLAQIYPTVTAEDYDALNEMNGIYMDMSERQQRYVKNADLLNTAFATASVFKQNEALNQLQKDIFALEVNTLDDTQGVLDARQAYDALPEDQKSIVKSSNLISAEEKLDILRQESNEAADSGTCGENIQWVLDGQGVLTISGTGAIENYSAGGAPWHRNYIFIRKIVLDSGITTVGDNAFSGLVNLKTVYYRGTQAQKDSILFGNSNDAIGTAQWHYGYEDIVLGSYLIHYCSCCDLYYLPDISMSVFADISDTSWQFKHAIYACKKGLMAGKGTDEYGRVKFDPNSPITREEFVQVLYNAEGKPAVISEKEFPDVKNDWYKNAVLWAYECGIASGLGDGRFGVGQNISRQDLALMLYKYAKMNGYDLTATEGRIDAFADGDKVSGYAKEAMNWAVTNGILSGKGTAGADISTFYLDPIGTATRAECAAMLKNFRTAFDLDNPECRHPDMTATTAKAATCVDNGNSDYWHCPDCDKYFSDAEAATQIEYTDTVIQSAGHSWNEATCTAPKTCATCGATEGSAPGHSLSFQETVAPTCSEQGYDLYKCANCDDTEKQNFTPVTDHNYVTMDLPAAATIAVEADPLGAGLNYAKYTVSDYCDYDTQICTGCNHIDLAATCFRYTQLEAAQMMLQWVNDLRAEVYGTHTYDLVLDDVCQRTAERRATELIDNYSHSGATLSENIDSRLGLYAQFLAWKNSSGHYNAMINKQFTYMGYGYADVDSTGVGVPDNAFGCMTFG